MERYFYEAVLTPNELGGYDARFPELDIITQGNDLADAAFMAQDLLTLVVSTALKDGKSIPSIGTFTNECPEGSTLMGIATFAEADDVLDETMTIQEAADVLNVSRPRIYALIKDGRIRDKQVGTSRLVYARDVMGIFNNPQGAGRPRKKLQSV